MRYLLPPHVRGLLFAVIGGAFVFTAGPQPLSAADGNQSVSVIRTQYSIEFGERISFEAELESTSAPIIEIQAIFEPNGSGTISSYSYPKFSRGNQVIAEFEIPTGNGSFFPPGIVFTVKLVVTDANGVQFTTDPVRIEYLDPQFDWRRRNEDGITIVYHDRGEGGIDRLFRAARQRMPELIDVYGLGSGRQFKAVIVNSTREADAAFPPTTEAARAGHTFAGFAFDEFDQFVIWGVNPTSFVHELAHLMFADAVSAPIAVTPAWLNEGLSVYFESPSGDSGDQRLRGARDQDDLMPIRNMNRVPGLQNDITLFYGKSGSFVQFLIDEFGSDNMAALLRVLNDGKRIPDAAATVYGYSLDNLDAVWTARQFGLEEPELAPLQTGSSPGAGPEPPATGEDVGVTPRSADAGESGSGPDRTPLDSPSASGDGDGSSGWPIVLFLILGAAVIAYFGQRLLKRRGA